MRLNPWKIFTGAYIPNWLAMRPEVSAGAKLCYARLMQYAGKKGSCFPKQSTLAQEVGMSRRNIIRSIKELIDCQLLELERTGGRSANQYFFLIHRWMGEVTTRHINGNHDVTDPAHQTGDDVPVLSHRTIRESKRLRESKSIYPPGDENVSRAKEWILWYGERYVEQLKDPYQTKWARDMIAVKRLLELHDFDELCRRALLYLAEDNPFIVRNAYSLTIFASSWNQYSPEIEKRKKEQNDKRQNGGRTPASYQGFDRKKYPSLQGTDNGG